MLDQIILEPEKITLKEFRIIKGHVESPLEFKMKHIREFSSNVTFDMGFNVEKNLVKTDLKVELQTESQGKNKKEAEAFFHIAFFFYVEDLSRFLHETTPKQVAVHTGLANAMVSVSYSTTRGIIFSRLQGTVLNTFILPIIDPNKLLAAKTD